jgi:hypothetical protein
MATVKRAIPLGKPAATLVFVLGWAVAIVLWSIAHLYTDPVAGGFVVDVGIIFAAVGFSAPFLASRTQLIAALMLGAIGIVLFALFGFGHVTVLVYLLRILVPLLALLTPLYKTTSFRIFA